MIIISCARKNQYFKRISSQFVFKSIACWACNDDLDPINAKINWFVNQTRRLWINFLTVNEDWLPYEVIKLLRLFCIYAKIVVSGELFRVNSQGNTFRCGCFLFVQTSVTNRYVTNKTWLLETCGCFRFVQSKQAWQIVT